MLHDEKLYFGVNILNNTIFVIYQNIISKIFISAYSVKLTPYIIITIFIADHRGLLRDEICFSENLGLWQ